jgi:hypothetical protein
VAALYDRIRPLIPHDTAAATQLAEAIKMRPVRPAVFALYTSLVEAIGANDSAAARRTADRLLETDPEGGATRVAMLDDGELGSGIADVYARLLNDDPGLPLPIAPVLDEQQAVAAVTAALALIDRSAPEMAAEIRGLAREIVAVRPAADPRDSAVTDFDGATTFYLWGAVFVNPVNRTVVDLAQTLAHETGHLLLFGLSPGEPLVENPDDERYASPLRQDPRPMEGIVHAAYVIARMHYFLAAALRAGALPEEDRRSAAAQAAGHIESFFDAAATIERHARFRPTGASVFRSAADYMKAAAAAGRRMEAAPA